VFLHGGGLSGRQWQPQLAQLTEFHLLAPDLPEQGRSAGFSPFTLELAAEHVARLIQTRATRGRAHVVGLSLGGAVGLTLMRGYPDLVASLFVSGTAAGLGRVLGALSLGSAWLYEVLPKRWLIDLSVKQFGIPPAFAESFREDLAIGANAEFTRSFTRALMRMVLPDEASSPTLVAVGERETLAARRAAKTLVERVAGARGVLVPGCGHVWNLEAPELFNATTRAWIAAAALPATLRPLG
jgi:pimeloyl-ACP methyl ester carboxylesterase